MIENILMGGAMIVVFAAGCFLAWLSEKSVDANVAEWDACIERYVKEGEEWCEKKLVRTPHDEVRSRLRTALFRIDNRKTKL